MRWPINFLFAFTALAQTPPDPHDHSHHGVPVEFEMPKTYAAAVIEIQNRMHVIEELMAAGRLDQIHGQADVIRKAAKVVGVLALNKDSGVPRDKLQEVTQASRALVLSFERIDQPADAGNAQGTADAYDEMKQLLAVLEAYVPKLYACPMRCRGSNVSKGVEVCAVCGMDYAELKAHADHTPRHGGTFFMAADNKHHLEGVLTAERKFRIYFYDEFTQPISAADFAGEGTQWSPQSPDKSEHPLKMQVDPNQTYLAAALDPALDFPIRVKVFVKIPRMDKPQVFDFEFPAPSEDPNPAATADRTSASQMPPASKGTP